MDQSFRHARILENIKICPVVPEGQLDSGGGIKITEGLRVHGFSVHLEGGGVLVPSQDRKQSIGIVLQRFQVEVHVILDVVQGAQVGLRAPVLVTWREVVVRQETD